MEKFRYLPKEKINNLPKSPGLYVFKKGTKFLYIGKATNIRERVKNHFKQPTYRANLFINQVKKIGYLKTNSEIEALILEANLIKKYQPKYNIVWRDDKNYFFVGITKEDFPRIFLTHQIKTKSQRSKVKSQYIGPFVDGKALKQALKVLRKVFPYRSCRFIPKHSCLWYHLNRCPAPCLLKVSFSGSQQLINFGEKIKKEAQKNARNLIKVLKEGKSLVLKNLRKEMRLASKNQNFEEAAKIRDQIRLLEKIMTHAKIFDIEPFAEFIKSEVEINKKWQEIEKILKEILGIEKRISRIEAYDVSNIQGQKATASMVTFINGQPIKKFYRKFKIEIQEKPNDIAMLKECLSRRFKHPEWGLPDLILLDGGRAHLQAILQFLSKLSSFNLAHLKVIALAKKKKELFIENQEKSILLKNLAPSVSNLILHLRDEAHRFAKKYHLKLREERMD